MSASAGKTSNKIKRRPFMADLLARRGDALVIPIYEEQLVVVKRLVLREQVRVRRQGATERQIFEDTIRRERLVVDDPAGTGLVHERQLPDESSDDSRDRDETRHEGGVLEKLGRRLLE